MDYTEWKLTDVGEKRVEIFIKECKAKRKEVLDAKIDTACHTHIPTKALILADINCGEDLTEDGYRSVWGVTDNYDLSIFLEYDVDIIEE